MTVVNNHTYRLIFIGAGFSRPAGLPLGPQLFKEVRRHLSAIYGSDNVVESDLNRYGEYLEKCEGISVLPESIDYEEFMGFLDSEHYLGLTGKDTWSSEGNLSQLMIRRAIAQLLYEMKPNSPKELYRQFIRGLNPTDTIYSFNYDTILEDACEAEGVPYSLVPWDWRTSRGSDVLTIHKLHGSIDWFDRSIYVDRLDHAKEFDPPYRVRHPIFDDTPIVGSEPLCKSESELGSSLAQIYRVRDFIPVLDYGYWACTPYILAPSYTKLFYSEPLKDLWRGLQRMGALHLGLRVIGYSLPAHDSYARQAIYRVFRNYQEIASDFEAFGRRKSKTKILDFQAKRDSGAAIRASYRFADWRMTELCLDGFSEESLDWILE